MAGLSAVIGISADSRSLWFGPEDPVPILWSSAIVRDNPPDQKVLDVILVRNTMQQAKSAIPVTAFEIRQGGFKCFECVVA